LYICRQLGGKYDENKDIRYIILMTKFKFGQMVWRAIIAKEYTVENVSSCEHWKANWLKLNF